ncbi:MAG: YggT family protein [Betaproteobacteria bacterium]|nr:YggT family protein [Betaproteobacteria bacterium]
MLGQIAVFLVDTVVTFFVVLLLLRFHFQWLRVPFQNPAGQFVLAMTSWFVMPVRRVIPGMRGYDLPTLLLAWALEALGLYARFVIVGGEPRAAAIAAVSAVELLRYSVYILMAAVIVQAVMSWFRGYSPFTPALQAMTAPFLRPFRRWIPPVGGFDLTPLVLVVLLQVIAIVLERGLLPAAAQLG